jgi:hypothetical protein
LLRARRNRPCRRATNERDELSSPHFRPRDQRTAWYRLRLGHRKGVTSALPPIATAKADIGKPSCLLYPSKWTCAVHTLTSALGQKQTSPIQLLRRRGRVTAVARSGRAPWQS